MVDAAQGIEAQTIANVYLALENDLALIAVINKIDLPSAQPEKVAQEISDLIGLLPDEDRPRLGQGGHRRAGDPAKRSSTSIPPPDGDADAPLRALIFDSHYDAYKGVIAYVKIVRRRDSERTTASA